MKAVLVNYDYTPTWLKESNLDYMIYDRSDDNRYLNDFPKERIIYTDNVGQVDYDKLGYLVGNYHDLPEVFLWGKTNLFKYITKEEYEKVKDNTTFTPLLTQTHSTYQDRFGTVCYYQDGMYYERNDSWYVQQFSSRFSSLNEFAQRFQIPVPAYVPFAPGGNYILTRDTVHRYSQDFYENLMNTLPYCMEPAEAQMCERLYYLIWR